MRSCKCAPVAESGGKTDLHDGCMDRQTDRGNVERMRDVCMYVCQESSTARYLQSHSVLHAVTLPLCWINQGGPFRDTLVLTLFSTHCTHWYVAGDIVRMVTFFFSLLGSSLTCVGKYWRGNNYFYTTVKGCCSVDFFFCYVFLMFCFEHQLFFCFFWLVFVSSFAVEWPNYICTDLEVKRGHHRGYDKPCTCVRQRVPADKHSNKKSEVQGWKCIPQSVKNWMF